MDLSYILNSPDVERVATALETIADKTVDTMNGKLDRDLGSGNAGKALMVGSDGKVALSDAGMSASVKTALLNIFQHVAYVDGSGQTYYNALYAALYNGDTPTPVPTPLPDGYTLLNYISTSGGQYQTGPYIDTLVTPTANTVLSIDFRFTDTSVGSSYGYGRIIGTGGGAGASGEINTRLCFGLDYQVGKRDSWYAAMGDTNQWFGANDTNRHMFVLDVPSKKFRVDEAEYSINYTEFLSGEKLYLFSRFTKDNNINVGVDRVNGELYGAAIWENGTLIRQFYPCIRDSDSAVGLFDTVNNVFYANAGTGSFVSGGVA